MIAVSISEGIGCEHWSCVLGRKEVLVAQRCPLYTESRWRVHVSLPVSFYAAQLSAFYRQLLGAGLDEYRSNALAAKRDDAHSSGIAALVSLAAPFPSLEIRTRYADIGLECDGQRWPKRNGSILIRTNQQIAEQLSELVAQTSHYAVRREELLPVLRNLYSFNASQRKPPSRACTP